jgi:hypothetical protein
MTTGLTPPERTAGAWPNAGRADATSAPTPAVLANSRRLMDFDM